MDTGSVADWVNAGGTLLAVAGAAFAGVVALHSYRTQRTLSEAQLAAQDGDERRRQAEERAAQASRVAVWVVRGRERWGVYAVNDSPLPVYRMDVRVVGGPLDLTVRRGVQGPTPARRIRRLSDAVTATVRAIEGDVGPDDQIGVEIVFDDAAGVRWHRAADGGLAEVPAGFHLPGVAVPERSFPGTDDD